jgi:hypothetical protein
MGPCIIMLKLEVMAVDLITVSLGIQMGSGLL